MFKKIIFAGAVIILLASTAASAQSVTDPQTATVTQDSLIAVLQQLVQILEQELTQLIAAQGGAMPTVTSGSTPTMAATTTAPSAATSTLSVNPAFGAAPLAITFSASYQQGDAIDFGDGSAPFQPTCAASWCNTAQSHTYPTPGMYKARLFQESGNATLQSVTVTAINASSTTPLASITSPAMQSEQNLVITGAAQNASAVIVTLVSAGASSAPYSGAMDWNTVGGYLLGANFATTTAGNRIYSYTVAVVGAHQFTVPFYSIPPGLYTVLVYNNDFAQFALMADGTVTVQ